MCFEYMHPRTHKSGSQDEHYKYKTHSQISRKMHTFEILVFSRVYGSEREVTCNFYKLYFLNADLITAAACLFLLFFGLMCVVM